MSSVVEKGIRRRICHPIYRYVKGNIKYIKDYDINKESSYLQYWDVNNLYSWAMSQRLPLNNSEWINDTQLNEGFIKNCDEGRAQGCFLEEHV